MQSIPRRWAVPAWLALTCSAGCAQRLSVEEERTITSVQPWILSIDGPEAEQRIRVHATADNAISVLVMLERDVTSDTDEDVTRQVRPIGALAHEVRKKDVTVEATIPPRQNFRVWVTTGSRRTPVRLKINSI
jgi:hypothetical protein